MRQNSKYVRSQVNQRRKKGETILKEGFRKKNKDIKVIAQKVTWVMSSNSRGNESRLDSRVIAVLDIIYTWYNLATYQLILT
jgi:hypothetical protein